jgi:hypothetical protein
MSDPEIYELEFHPKKEGSQIFKNIGFSWRPNSRWTSNVFIV